jgi:hypothetical protein
MVKRENAEPISPLDDYTLWQRIERCLAGFCHSVVGVALQVPFDSSVYVWRLGCSLIADLRSRVPSVARAAAVRHNLGLDAVREKIANSFPGTLSRRTHFASGRGFIGHVDDITLLFLPALVL